MGDFRSFERGGRDSRGGDRRNFSSDRREGGRSYGGRDGGSRGGFGGDRRESRDRRELPFCDAVCASCGKDCKVPFKPTGDKPVYCRACFNKEGGDSRGSERVPERSSSPSSFAGSGVSAAQFKQLSDKVDKILEILESLETDDEDEEEDEE